ncbi:MAG: polysaccharide deacetylase [Candidatus Ozemobacter sibiricus]|uniref:Polysaccharide deacetylase n=1 Tax=Candidatus Ozemobacter sibiricus TaxID=2268124 RepID=A0A367ZFR7_9BACT|nr:MAG: polysaccharide deacetylase [Candidatus Ozemobacter sibiricus]
MHHSCCANSRPLPGGLLLLLFTLATGVASAALTPLERPGATPPALQAAPASRPAQALALEEEATEGGFVFYNRKLIAETMGRMRQLLLTFDDGPHPVTTPQVLDILKRWNVKGVFFVVGMNARKYPDLVRRIHAEGHTIGNHTWYHLNLKKFSPERIRKEIRETNDLIQQLTGVRPRLFRPPYGSLNATVVEILRQEGMDIMLWTFDPRDWRNRSMVQTVASLKKQLHLENGGKGGIILLHDPLPSTAASLDPLLAALSQSNLLPTAYHRGPTQGREFWAARSPFLWRTFHWKRPFQPDGARYPVLTSLLQPPPPGDFSAMALLRAKKSGQLFTTLVTRAF